jgi:hypothetical protein
MTPLQVAFLQRLVSDRPPYRPHRGVAAQMAEAEGLGRVAGARVIYQDRDYLAAENILRTRGHPVSAPAPGFTRSNAPTGGSEKAGAARVSQGLVALVPVNMNYQLPGGTQFLAIPWQEAARLPHEAILVCENLEPLPQLASYQWLANFIKGRPTLAVFRGGPGYFRTDATAQLLRHLATPVLGFFDFDPRGLCMAAALPRLEALCLPEWDRLEAAVNAIRRDHLFAEQVHASRAQLDALKDGDLATAWSRMKSLSKGLNQEGFPR